MQIKSTIAKFSIAETSNCKQLSSYAQKYAECNIQEISMGHLRNDIAESCRTFVLCEQFSLGFKKGQDACWWEKAMFFMFKGIFNI